MSFGVERDEAEIEGFRAWLAAGAPVDQEPARYEWIKLMPRTDVDDWRSAFNDDELAQIRAYEVKRAKEWGERVLGTPEKMEAARKAIAESLINHPIATIREEDDDDA